MSAVNSLGFTFTPGSSGPWVKVISPRLKYLKLPETALFSVSLLKYVMYPTEISLTSLLKYGV